MVLSSSRSGYIPVLFIHSSLTIAREMNGTKNGEITGDDAYHLYETRVQNKSDKYYAQ